MSGLGLRSPPNEVLTHKHPLAHQESLLPITHTHTPPAPKAAEHYSGYFTTTTGDLACQFNLKANAKHSLGSHCTHLRTSSSGRAGGGICSRGTAPCIGLSQTIFTCHAFFITTATGGGGGRKKNELMIYME